ncbi:MAG: hypothetical protein ABIP20_11595 [Chthoniobacteraceae bacterium]
MANPPDHKALIAELAASRDSLTAYTTAIRHDLDFGAKVTRSFHGNQTAWLGGAALLGLLLSKLLPARRKVVIPTPVAEVGKAAFALTALKFALNFAKPALFGWMRDRWLNRAAKRSAA